MGEEEGERVTEWERGLPSADDLTPLSQVLIPPGLASAFSISPEPYKTFLDVTRASETTFSGLRSGSGSGGAVILLNDDLIGDDDDAEDDGGDDAAEDGDRNRKLRRIDLAESEEKRPRLVWTPQLHKRFVEVVAHLGIKNAVPKTIMQLMNVEGLTRENVASHLQKYRLYLKRMQGGQGGGSCEGSRARPDPPPSNGNVNRNSNNSSSDGGSSDGYHPRQVAFHPHPEAAMMMQMQMPMYGDMGGNGGSGSGVGGGSSNHHHHHFHHHQHQFNGYDNGGAGRSGAQSGFNAGFGYHGSSYPHRATPSDA